MRALQLLRNACQPLRSRVPEFLLASWILHLQLCEPCLTNPLCRFAHLACEPCLMLHCDALGFDAGLG